MRTKKVNAIFILTLIVGAILSYGCLSFIEYDRRNVFIFKGISTIIPAILSFVFSVVILKIGQDTVSVSALSDEDRNELRKRSNKLIVQNSVLYILLISFMCYLHDTNIYFDENLTYSFSLFNLISYICFSILTILPANFMLSFTYKSINIRIPEIIPKIIAIVSIIILIFTIIITAYKFIPISGFKYLFDTNKKGVWVKDKIFADVRTNTEVIELPSKIFGMKVAGLLNVSVTSDKIVLPDSCTGENLDTYFTADANINTVEGANVFTNDGIIYSVDKKYMNFLMKSSENNFKGSKLNIYKETEYITGDITNLKNVSKIEVEEGNNIFKAYEGALYITSQNAKNYSAAPNGNEGELLIILPSKMSPSIVIDDISNSTIDIETKLPKFKVRIGANVEDIRIKGNISQYEVDEKNNYYSSYMGNLYSKDKKELLFIANRNTTEKLAKEIEHISNDAIKSLNSASRARYDIKLEYPSDNLCIINGVLMNKAQTIMYAIAKRIDIKNKIINVGPDVKIISKDLMEYANSIPSGEMLPYGYSLSPDNEYMSKVSYEGIEYKTGYTNFEKKSIYDEETDSLGIVGRQTIVEIDDSKAEEEEKEKMKKLENIFNNYYESNNNNNNNNKFSSGDKNNVNESSPSGDTNISGDANVNVDNQNSGDNN